MDHVSKEVRSKIMGAIKSKNTKLEKHFFAFLEESNLKGFTYHPKNIYGNPDIIFQYKKIAIFLDSCFWHGCPEHFRLPKTNKNYWINKIQKNINRDKYVNATLNNQGWRVIRIWEHDIIDELDREYILKKIKDVKASHSCREDNQLLYVTIEKRLSWSDRRRHWIQIGKKYRKSFPDPHSPFKICINNEVEETYVDNYDRIMLGSILYHKYNLEEPDTIIIYGKDACGYFIKRK